MELYIYKSNFKKMAILMVLFFILTILSCGFVSATNHTVSGNDFDSIQGVADVANPGDAIFLGNKTYTYGSNKNIKIITDNLVIKGQSTNFKARLNGMGSN